MISGSGLRRLALFSLAGGLTFLFLWAAFEPAAADQGDPPPADCSECHLAIELVWQESKHANAFDNPQFQEQWLGYGQRPSCLHCHTSGFDLSTGSYQSTGVTCLACHGLTPREHPPAAVDLKTDSSFCGSCHPTTLSEWRLSAHAAEGVDCVDCHDPHSQGTLFKTSDDLCLECHKEDMADYLDDRHIAEDIGCVDCHAVMIPPEVFPEDGLLPTAHSFTISAISCVVCHTDTLHAGTPIAGYEHGAAAAAGQDDGGEDQPDALKVTALRMRELERTVADQSAALASRSLMALFQGSVVGVSFGGALAWLLAKNLKKREQVDGQED